MYTARAHPELFDVAFTDFDDDRSAEWYASALAEFGPPVRRSNFKKQLGRYRYVINVGGVVDTWRGHELFASGAVVLYQASKFHEFFLPDLTPGVHYIRIQEDLSDLVETVLRLEAHPEEAERIAEAGRTEAERLFAMETVDCYIRDIVSTCRAASNYSLDGVETLMRKGFNQMRDETILE
jgi:hypothetical protein